MKYSFKIMETYSKSVEVEAESEDEAFEKVRDSYEAGEIEFDAADDFEEWEIFPERWAHASSIVSEVEFSALFEAKCDHILIEIT